MEISRRVLRSCVFRLNKDSTFTGRLLLSARPDVERGWIRFKREFTEERLEGRKDVRKGGTEGSKSARKFKKAEKKERQEEGVGEVKD